MLTVSGLSYTAEAVTFYNTLETFTLRCADNVDKLNAVKHRYGYFVSQFVAFIKTFDLQEGTP